MMSYVIDIPSIHQFHNKTDNSTKILELKGTSLKGITGAKLPINSVISMGLKISKSMACDGKLI